MQDVAINFAAVAAAAAIRVVATGIWYSPAVFGRSWEALTGISQQETQECARTGLPADIAGSLLLAFVLVHALRYAGAASVSDALMVGFWNWVGFIAVTTLSVTVWEKRPLKLYVLYNGLQLLVMLAASVVLTLWK